MELLEKIIAIAALVLGFGFVVFWHELGHFLAAKWVGIKVEQFAVGMGQAIFSWRKGLGFRLGSSIPEYERRVKAEIDNRRKSEPVIRDSQEYSDPEIAAASQAIGLSETEYRFNWMPIGGYVKMLGQDDLNPTAQAEDPRAFNKKSVPARMLVVSAGVIMNVILAAILFMVVFLIGFNVPPAVIGSVMPGSPAQQAKSVRPSEYPDGLRVGDRVTYFDGQYQHDFNKLQLATALVDPGQPAKVQVIRDGKYLDFEVQPVKASKDSGAFFMLGVSPIAELHGPKKELGDDLKKKLGERYDPATQVLAGDTVVAVNGEAIDVKGNPVEAYKVYDRHVQQSGDKPLVLSVRDAGGAERSVTVPVFFMPPFGEVPFNIAGLQPRPVIRDFEDASPAKGKLQRGDVIVSLTSGDRKDNPTVAEFVAQVAKAGAAESKVSFTVEREGKLVEVEPIVPTMKLGKGRRGLGVAPGVDTGRPIVTGIVADSPADKAEKKIPSGSLITKVNETPVESWFQVHRLLRDAEGTPKVTYVRLENGQPQGEPATVELPMDTSARQALAGLRYAHGLMFLDEHRTERKTSSPLTAVGWGVTETRDLLLQFYVTLHRLAVGSVSASNLMGPIGIVHAGSLFATRGPDWLIWFLAMISANLAVVNFLPIPILDGGLFVFLILEKVSGRPPSPRMQAVAQYVGLAIILSIFLLVTYQDIARLFF